MNTAALIAEAREINAKRDQLDRRVGLAAPQDAPLEVHAKTVGGALVAAMAMGDWSTVAEAYVMLEDVITRIKKEAAQ